MVSFSLGKCFTLYSASVLKAKVCLRVCAASISVTPDAQMYGFPRNYMEGSLQILEITLSFNLERCIALLLNICIGEIGVCVFVCITYRELYIYKYVKMRPHLCRH